MDRAIFGPAGNPDSFYEKGHSASIEMPGYLKEVGLGAYEYQCGKGVNISQKTANALGAEAQKNGVFLSLHAPYYISMSNPGEENVIKTIKYVTDSMQAAKDMGAKRVIVHTGALMKMTREEAMANVKSTLKRVIDECDAMHFSDINLCPETMGKTNQLGDLPEVLDLCQMDERLIPTIDFGHLNARSFGSLKTYEDFLHLFDELEDKLGKERAKNFHSHFSKIEYTIPGGEKRHLTFDDDLFGPDFSFVGRIIAERDMTPVIICESAGTQAIDALEMQRIYESFLKGKK